MPRPMPLNWKRRLLRQKGPEMELEAPCGPLRLALASNDPMGVSIPGGPLNVRFRNIIVRIPTKETNDQPHKEFGPDGLL